MFNSFTLISLQIVPTNKNSVLNQLIDTWANDIPFQ